MEIRPVKNYKKPNYAIKAALAATAAALLTGCTADPSIEGSVPAPEEQQVTYAPEEDASIVGTVVTSEDNTTTEANITSELNANVGTTTTTAEKPLEEPPVFEGTVPMTTEAVTEPVFEGTVPATTEPEPTETMLEGGAPMPTENEEPGLLSKLSGFVSGIFASKKEPDIGGLVPVPTDCCDPEPDEEMQLEGDVAMPSAFVDDEAPQAGDTTLPVEGDNK